MASALPDPVALMHADERASRIARRTDARCLEHMLPHLRRTYLLLPMGVLWAWLAWSVGAGWWALVWFVAWAGLQIEVYRSAGRFQADTDLARQVGILHMTRLFWVAGGLHTVLLPLFFIGTSVETKLEVTLLLAWIGGTAVISCSGIRQAYAGMMVPTTFGMAAGWFWHGGVVGYGLAVLYGGSLLVGFVTVRQQRRSWEELVCLLDANETLSAKLTSERDRAEAASESKTRFFAAASHDLRQPLHALSINATTLDLVARRSADPLLKELSQGIANALRQSRGLLDGLLDISRLDAHAVQTHLAPHDLGAVLDAVREEYAALAAQRGLSLEVDTGGRDAALWALTDADQLLRILANLVDNAIKFTPEGGVLLSARRAAPGRVLIRVSDTGPGIAEAERERVFEEFYQVGNPSRDRSQGLGLGLAIVKRTAALLQIELNLVCTPGSGTSFELSLPAAASGIASSQSPVKELNVGKPLAVLLVDDEPDVRTSLCTYLRQIGWTAKGVASGDEAEQAIAEGFRADVLVVDFRLRDETGQDVIERLRERNHVLPVVIVTGDTSPERLRELAGLAASVLHKPIDGERLARALLEAVGDMPQPTEPSLNH